MDAGGLVQTSQSPLVVLPLVGIIRHDVPLVVPGQVVDGGLNDLHPTRLPHGLGGEVTVGSGSVLVSKCIFLFLGGTVLLRAPRTAVVMRWNTPTPTI